jgi:RNA polymerase sigma-70 factor (ECF subfamily)
MQATDDPALVAAIRAGESSAFETLVRREMPRLVSVARRILNNEEDAREAVQQGFVAAFRAREQFHGDSLVSTWLHRIVVNKALDALRARQRRPEESIEVLLPRFLPNGHHVEHFSTWPEMESLIDRERMAEVVRDTIRHLPETFRLVLLLRDIEEMSTEETAQALGVTPNAVKLRLHRARMALRTLLTERLKEHAHELS